MSSIGRDAVSWVGPSFDGSWTGCRRAVGKGGAGDVKGSPLEGVLELFESDVVRGFIRDDTPC